MQGWSDQIRHWSWDRVFDPAFHGLAEGFASTFLAFGLAYLLAHWQFRREQRRGNATRIEQDRLRQLDMERESELRRESGYVRLCDICIDLVSIKLVEFNIPSLNWPVIPHLGNFATLDRDVLRSIHQATRVLQSLSLGERAVVTAPVQERSHGVSVRVMQAWRPLDCISGNRILEYARAAAGNAEARDHRRQHTRHLNEIRSTCFRPSHRR